MAAPVYQSSALTNGSPATSIDVSKPSGVASGDVLVAFISVVNADGGEVAPTPTPPAGWTEIAGAFASKTGPTPDHGVRAYWRRADGSEGASFTWTFANAYNQGIVLRISGAVASGSPVDVAGASVSGSTSTNASAPSVTTTVADCLLVFVGSSFNFGYNTGHAPTGMTARATSNSMEACTETLGAAGATGTRVATNAPASSDWTSGALIALAPDAGAPAITGAGAVTIAAPALAGVGAETITGTGATSIGAPALSGAGLSLLGVVGAGAVAIGAPALAGAGGSVAAVVGTGAVVIGAPALAGTDIAAAPGTVAWTVLAPTATLVARAPTATLEVTR